MGNKDCNEVIEEKNATLNKFERNKFFYGKLMTVRDFELEQNYFNGKRHLLNRLIHGVGLLCGLEVDNPIIEGNTLEINLTSGAALDCWGREIVVDKTYEGLEVKGTFDNTKLNYLYLKQKPCLKDPVPVLANASTCEQECCYSRITEGFEVVLGSKPKTISGKVSSSDETPIPISGAKVEALQKELVKATTITDSEGDYTLIMREGSYTIRVTASGYKEKSREEVNASSENIDFSLETDGSGTKEYKDIPQDYYEEHLKECPECDCDDPKVLIAVAKKTDSGVGIDEDETYKYRSVVYNNPMLYDLLCDHLSDFANPHKTTATQVGALKRVDGVSNPGGNVDLKPKNSITIEPDDTANNITIGETHSVKTGNPHHTKHSEVEKILPVDPTKTDTVRDKHASNADAKKWNSTIRKVNDIGPVAETGNFTIKAKAGGNITITPDAQTSSITISSTGGLYLEYPDRKVLTLEGKASARIEHNFKRYPVVDIYEYHVEGDVYSLVTPEDLGLIATLTGKSTSVVETEMGAESLNKFARKIEVSIRRDARLTTAVNELNATATLGGIPPLILSDRASALLNKPILEVLDNVRVISKIAYLRKTVDSEGRSGPPIEVRHETKNTVKVINNSNESVRIKIILTA